MKDEGNKLSLMDIGFQIGVCGALYHSLDK